MLPFPLPGPFPGGSGRAGAEETSPGSWSRWKENKEMRQLNATSEPELDLGPEREKTLLGQLVKFE